MLNKKWKFIHNGDCWVLRIENKEQLLTYIDATDTERYGEQGMLLVAHRALDKAIREDTDEYPIADTIESLYRVSGKSLLSTAGSFVADCHNSYIKAFNKFGFLNISKNGSCNPIDYDIKATVYKDTISFPDYKEKDIVLKTFNQAEENSYERPLGYNYHWYAYLGDVRLVDGDKIKWDTKDEAYEYAKRFITK